MEGFDADCSLRRASTHTQKCNRGAHDDATCDSEARNERKGAPPKGPPPSKTVAVHATIGLRQRKGGDQQQKRPIRTDLREVGEEQHDEGVDAVHLVDRVAVVRPALALRDRGTSRQGRKSGSANTHTNSCRRAPRRAISPNGHAPLPETAENGTGLLRLSSSLPPTIADTTLHPVTAAENGTGLLLRPPPIHCRDPASRPVSHLAPCRRPMPHLARSPSPPSP